MEKANDKEIKNIVDAYQGKRPAEPLDPEVMAVCAAAMKPAPGATAEERRTFENMQKIVTGTK